MGHIFVSYSRRNSDCVYKIVDRMKQYNFPIWIDLEAIEITSKWLKSIEDAIDSASVFMLFWSKDAKASDYVKHERDIAEQLAISKKLKILVVQLDDTELPYKHLQAHNMQSGCTSTAVDNFIHNILKTESTLLSETEYSKAYVHSPFGIQPDKPKDLAVALQFFRPINFDMLPSVKSSMDNHKWILHVTGAHDGTQYSLDNNNPEQWEVSRKHVVETIQAIGDQPTTTLHFFTLTPNALLGGITMPLYRFWHVKLYNFVPATNTYQMVVDIPRG